jgi:voltage-gated potassium channel
MTLKQTIEDCDTPAGKAFDLTVQFFVVLSLVTFSIGTLPGLSDTVRQALEIIEISTVLLFTLEYLLRVWVADKSTKFVFSFFGLVDLLSILPYLISGIDLRAVRSLRLLRLFRILKLARYGKAVERLSNAAASIREELLVFASLACILIFLSSVGIYYCERVAQPEVFASIFHALWWSVITLTTVGYGDIVPVTLAGKLLTSGLLMLGLAIIAVPGGLLASALTRDE